MPLRSDIHQEILDAKNCKFVGEQIGESDGSTKTQFSVASIDGKMIGFLDFWDKDGMFQGFRIFKEMNKSEVSKVRNKLKKLEE